MASINQLKEWFKDLAKPTGSQFANLIDSFFHKDATIPIEKIEGLQDILAKKAAVGSVGTVVSGGAAKPTDIRFGDMGAVTEFRLPWSAALAAVYGPNPAFVWPTVVVGGQLIYPDITFDYTPNNLSILFVFGPDPKSGIIYIR